MYQNVIGNFWEHTHTFSLIFKEKQRNREPVSCIKKRTAEHFFIVVILQLCLVNLQVYSH